MANADCTRVHTCAHCGGGFTGRKKRFCSLDCQVKAKTGHDPAGHKCHECGARFTGRKKKYCSTECADSAKVKRDRKSKGRDPNAPPKYKRVAQRLEYPPGVETEAQKRQWRFHNDPAYRAKEKKRRKKYLDPLSKRIYRFRLARRQGRKPNYKPLPAERPIWRAHLARSENWRRYLKACERIDNPTEPSPAKLMTPEQARMSDSREWKWRYSNDPKFRAKEKARLFLTKQRRRYQQEVTDDGTVTAEHIDQRKTCLYCGTGLTKRNRTLDHMTPLIKGGAHSASNVVECCKSCNSRKHAKDFGQWLDELEPQDRRRAEREWMKRKGAPPQQAPLFG